MALSLAVQREPDTGPAVDELVPFALAVMLAMCGVAEIYEQVCDRLREALRQPLR